MTAAILPTLDETQDRVRRALHTRLGDVVDELGDTEDLPTALGDRYDSLAALECITRIEAEFGIEVDFVAHDVRYIFATIGRISTFVHEQLEDLAILQQRG